MDSVHSDTGSLPHYFVHVCLRYPWAQSCNYGLTYHSTTGPGDICVSDTYNQPIGTVKSRAQPRKLATPEEGQQVCSSSFQVHQSNTLH